MVDRIVVKFDTKMDPVISFNPFHVHWPFGLNTGIFSLHHCHSRTSAKIFSELLKKDHKSITPYRYPVEVSPAALAAEYPSRGDSFTTI